MQYFPGIDPTHDFYANQDGVYQQVFSVNSTYDSFPYYNPALPPSPISHGHLNIDVIKQTIFEHEAIFRNQVMELHRLYGRQRQLMNEVGNNSNRESMQVGLSSSEYGLIDKKQSSVSWLSHLVSSPATRTNSLKVVVENSVQTDKGKCQVEHASRKCELFSAKCKKYNNKVLDLKLLATEYMDEEDDKLSIVASQISATHDEYSAVQPLWPDFREKGLHVESVNDRRFLFDLNQPYNIEEATPSMSPEDFLSMDLSTNKLQLVGCSDDTDKSVYESVENLKDGRHSETMVKANKDNDTGQKTNDSNPSSFVISVDSPSFKPKNCGEHSRVDPKHKRLSKKRALNSRKAQGCLPFSEKDTRDTLIRVPKSLQLTPLSNRTVTLTKLDVPVHSMLDFRRNPVAYLALPCANSPLLMKKKKYSRATGVDGDSNQLSELQRHKLLTEKGLLNPLVDHVEKSNKCKKRRNVRVRNVNQDSYQLEPVSPENEECSPPRGKSNGNVLEMRPYFYSAEVGTTEAGLAKLAAKTIVYLSKADFHMDRCSLFGSDNPLHWLAEVVSDVELTTESEEGLMFHDLDDFETMTLKLEDTNTEHQYCHNIIISQDEKSTLATSVSNRVTKARGWRSRKLKDFQGVVLPNISSLSRHEVTEDLQLIECLMETTKTPKGFVSEKRRPRRKKKSSGIALLPADSSPSLLDLQNENCEHHTSERRPMMFDWGRITKRRRGQRSPARKLTFSHLSPTLKAH